MSLFSYDHNANGVLHKLDPRTKLFFAIYMTIISMIISDLFSQVLYFSLVVIIVWTFIGYQQIIGYLRSLWLFIVILSLILVFLSTFNLQAILLLIAKISTILMSFMILNQTTSPDQIVEALIRLKVPSSIAWTIGITLRQSIFLVEDIEEVMSIYDIRSKFENNNTRTQLLSPIKQRIKRINPLFSSALSRSIVNAQNMGDVLVVRGWKGAHQELALHSLKLSKIDYYSIILIIITSIMINMIR